VPPDPVHSRPVHLLLALSVTVFYRHHRTHSILLSLYLNVILKRTSWAPLSKKQYAFFSFYSLNLSFYLHSTYHSLALFCLYLFIVYFPNQNVSLMKSRMLSVLFVPVSPVPGDSEYLLNEQWMDEWKWWNEWVLQGVQQTFKLNVQEVGKCSLAEVPCTTVQSSTQFSLRPPWVFGSLRSRTIITFSCCLLFFRLHFPLLFPCLDLCLST
jgi:hypothetical protein